MPPESLQLLISISVISILHAILPNHWLPVVAISRQFKWNARRTALITMLTAIAHSLSTVIIGIGIAYGGMQLESFLPYFRFVAAGLLMALGILFIWRHQHHLHFHMRAVSIPGKPNMLYIIGSLMLAMFLSPCLEVGALFFVSGANGMMFTIKMAAIYTLTSAIGMTAFAWLAMQGLKKIDWHRVEHNSGLISGIVLLLTGILFIFIH